jgi:hypothetical protein
LQQSTARVGAPEAALGQPNAGGYLSLLRRLFDARADFILVGGLAMRAHGSMETQDLLEICYRSTPANVHKVHAALEPLQTRLRGDFTGKGFRFEPGMNLALATAAGSVTLFAGLVGIGSFDHILAQSVLRRVDGLPIWILSLEGMIAAKTAACTLKDQYDLLQLLDLKNLDEAADVPFRITP